MRVLALTNLYPTPLQPNRAPFNRQQLAMLRQRHHVRVIAPIAWTDELVARRRLGKVVPSGRRVQLDGLEVAHPRYIFPPRVLRAMYGWCFYRSVRRSFARALTEFRPDLIYATWAYPDGWAAVKLGQAAGLPVVVKVHGSDVLMLDRQPGLQAGTRSALTAADAVVAVSVDLRERVIALGASPSRVRVIYNGVDVARFHPGSSTEAQDRLGVGAGEPIILFVGHLVPVKGVEVLVDACARLARARVPFRAHLVGGGFLRARLDRQIRRLGLEQRVRLFGAVSNDALADWYRSASVVALPSYSEGVPNVLLEAAACGIPFVASRVGGVPEIANPGRSELIPPGDPAALARALIRAMRSASAARPPAPPHVRTHEDAVSELEEVFESTLRRPCRCPRTLRSPARSGGVAPAVG